MTKVFVIFTLLIASFNLYAIDNPDAPNYVDEFQNRMKPFEEAATSSSIISEVIQKYHQYEQELDKELNIAYKLLQSKLDSTNKALLKKSQINWLKFRDSEFTFMENNFTPDKNGREIYYSIGAYKTTLIKNRVIQLLYYLLNYGK